MDPERKEVFYYALCSRVVFLLLSALSDICIPNLNNDGFKTAAYIERDYHSEDFIIWKLFGGLLQWDAHHYLHIAQFGYSYENNLAFFPLFPLLIRTVGDLVQFCGITKSSLSAYLLGAVLLNNVIFVKTALILYDLTLFIFNDTKYALRTTIFFCVTPATIFFIAPYTETLFSYCAFNGMLDFSRRKTKQSLFWFFMSVCLRSNGITFAGFILHAWAYCCISQFSITSLKYNINLTLRFTYHTVQYVLYIFSPYLVFQLYSYLIFCLYKPIEERQLIIDHAEIYNLTVPSDFVCWCNKGLISPYFAIQEKLWDVGFLKYYKLKQIPQFLLALPICYIIIKNGILYLKRNLRMLINPKRIYSYGIFLAEVKKTQEDYPPSVFLFFIHALFLTIWGLLHINVQVLTRLVASSSPILYWIAANQFEGLPKNSAVNDKILNKFYVLPFEKGRDLSSQAFIMKWYFISYAFVGVVFYSNGLPWT